jgi:spermidine synthase
MYCPKATWRPNLPEQNTKQRTAKIEYATVETADSPLGEVMLRSYVADTGETGYEIHLNGNFLMATHGNHSEMAMAHLARQKLKSSETALRVLVGGLGAGYTLRATLDLEGVSRVVVVEISEKVAEWNRKFFSRQNGNALDDQRTELRLGNLSEHLASNPSTYDMILVDVDNGPGWMAAKDNEKLYDAGGLRLLRNALTPGGVLAVWSPGKNELFEKPFWKVFHLCEAVDTTPIGRLVQEPGDIIYLGVRP